MIRMVERKVRERARQLYEERGQIEGQALADWVQAETEILENTTVAPLYRRARESAQIVQRNNDSLGELSAELAHDSQPACESA